MDELLKWIEEKENILNEKDQEPIPEDDYDEVQLLLEEHKVCRDNQKHRDPSWKSHKRPLNLKSL